MNTHSYKVNKYEPFKTHQKKFLETFRMKIQQNTFGKRGCTALIQVPLLLDSGWLSVEPVKYKRPELLLQDRVHDLGELLHFSSPPTTLSAVVQKQELSSSFLEWEKFQVRSSRFYWDKPQPRGSAVNSVAPLYLLALPGCKWQSRPWAGRPWLFLPSLLFVRWLHSHTYNRSLLLVKGMQRILRRSRRPLS